MDHSKLPTTDNVIIHEKNFTSTNVVSSEATTCDGIISPSVTNKLKTRKVTKAKTCDVTSELKIRKVSEYIKKKVAGRQHYKCANRPEKNLSGLDGFVCPLWKSNCEDKGCFDESGYEIDHVIEFGVGGKDDESNLQALCKSCHTVKTKRFMSVHMKIDEDILSGPHDNSQNNILKFSSNTKVKTTNTNNKQYTKLLMIGKLLGVDETKFSVNELVNKQKHNALNPEEELILEKLCFIKNFGVAEINDEFKLGARIDNTKMNAALNTFYGRESVLKNYSLLVGRYENFNITKDDISRVIIVIDIINRLLNRNGDLFSSKITPIHEYISHEDYQNRTVDIIKNSGYFKYEKFNRNLFFQKKILEHHFHGKKNVAVDDTITISQSHTKIIKHILKKFGIELNSDKFQRIKKDNKSVSRRVYSLYSNPNVHNIVSKIINSKNCDAAENLKTTTCPDFIIPIKTTRKQSVKNSIQTVKTPISDASHSNNKSPSDDILNSTILLSLPDTSQLEDTSPLKDTPQLKNKLPLTDSSDNFVKINRDIRIAFD